MKESKESKALMGPHVMCFYYNFRQERHNPHSSFFWLFTLLRGDTLSYYSYLQYWEIMRE